MATTVQVKLYTEKKARELATKYSKRDGKPYMAVHSWDGDRQGWAVLDKVEQAVTAEPVRPTSMVLVQEVLKAGRQRVVCISMPYLKETGTSLVGTDDKGVRRWFNKGRDAAYADDSDYPGTRRVYATIPRSKAKQMGLVA